jgi:REP-associated tyrosine transposase
MTLFNDQYRVESTRLRGWNYGSRGWYFVTICARSRARIFGEVVANEMHLSPVGLIADSELRAIHTHYAHVQVDEHVVMPNHVHAIIMIDGDHCFSPRQKISEPGQNATNLATPQAGSLSAIVRSFKAGVTRRCHELGMERVIWQSRFHDHLLRGDKVISAVREYIRNNPANWETDNENPVPHDMTMEFP